jgi:hypothetical protein
VFDPKGYSLYLSSIIYKSYCSLLLLSIFYFEPPFLASAFYLNKDGDGNDHRKNATNRDYQHRAPKVCVVAHAQSFVIADIITGPIRTLYVLVVVTPDPITFSTGCLNIVRASRFWQSYHGARVEFGLLR